MDGSKKRYPAAVRQQQILNIAQKLFAERGYETTTVRDIGQALGITEQAVFQHFPTKESIYDQLFEKWAETKKQVITYDIVENSAIKTLWQLYEDFQTNAFREKHLHPELMNCIYHRYGMEDRILEAEKNGADLVSCTILPIVIYGRSSGEIRMDIAPYELASAVWMWLYTAGIRNDPKNSHFVNVPFDLCIELIRNQNKTQ